MLRAFRGSIVADPAAGMHEVHGAIFAFWMQQGGLSGPLGAPTEDAVVPEDPRLPTTQRFAGGALAWSSAQGVTRTA